MKLDDPEVIISNMFSTEFDTTINRRQTSCYKWDFDKKLTGRENLLPFWVADMDFPAAPSILQAMQSRLDHGVFGYTARPVSLDDALVGWFSKRHGWNIDKDHILEVPGIVPFIHMIVRELALPGDSVIIQEPVYFPFRQAIENNGRHVAVNHLFRDDSGRWRMDLENLSDLIDKNGAKLLVLCSPHNPVGRVWERNELLDLADLCRRKGVTVISDEIHADLVHAGSRHIPWLSLPADRLPPSLSLVSATKSFNIPGLNIAFAIVAGTDFRNKIQRVLTSFGIGKGSSSPLSYAATETAWREGGEWLDSLLVYLAGNDRLLRDFLKSELPAVKVSDLEGTYLEWLEMASPDRTDDQLWEALLDAGIWLSRGRAFGNSGEGFMRMNIACPRGQLQQGLDMIAGALFP